MRLASTGISRQVPMSVALAISGLIASHPSNRNGCGGIVTRMSFAAIAMTAA
jgi:hypothetical protein